MQLIIVLTVDKVAIGVFVLAADARTLVIDVAPIVRLGEMPALVFDVDVPIPFLDEDRNILVTQIPADIVEILPRLRCFNGQRKIPTTQPRALMTMTLFGHPASPKAQ